MAMFKFPKVKKEDKEHSEDYIKGFKEGFKKGFKEGHNESTFDVDKAFEKIDEAMNEIDMNSFFATKKSDKEIEKKSDELLKKTFK